MSTFAVKGSESQLSVVSEGKTVGLIQTAPMMSGWEYRSYASWDRPFTGSKESCIKKARNEFEEIAASPSTDITHRPCYVEVVGLGGKAGQRTDVRFGGATSVQRVYVRSIIAGLATDDLAVTSHWVSQSISSQLRVATASKPGSVVLLALADGKQQVFLASKPTSLALAAKYNAA